jgi:hypothetical protein
LASNDNDASSPDDKVDEEDDGEDDIDDMSQPEVSMPCPECHMLLYIGKGSRKRGQANPCRMLFHSLI